MVKTENFLQVQVTGAAELRQWLANNYQQKQSVWLVTYKKLVANKYVSTSEVLDELLCFGWIDGIKRKIDEEKVMQMISPRRVEHWTQTYKDRFAKLEKEGRMMDAGREAVQRSKAAGLWNLMDDVDKLIKPADFVESLQNHSPASQNFDAFAPSSQRFILRWIKLSKTDATRAKRIELAATLAAQNKKIPGV